MYEVQMKLLEDSTHQCLLNNKEFFSKGDEIVAYLIAPKPSAVSKPAPVSYKKVVEKSLNGGKTMTKRVEVEEEKHPHPGPLPSLSKKESSSDFLVTDEADFENLL
jgi:hypothetical protein